MPGIPILYLDKSNTIDAVWLYSVKDTIEYTGCCDEFFERLGYTPQDLLSRIETEVERIRELFDDVAEAEEDKEFLRERLDHFWQNLAFTTPNAFLKLKADEHAELQAKADKGRATDQDMEKLNSKASAAYGTANRILVKQPDYGLYATVPLWFNYDLEDIAENFAHEFGAHFMNDICVEYWDIANSTMIELMAVLVENALGYVSNYKKGPHGRAQTIYNELMAKPFANLDFSEQWKLLVKIRDHEWLLPYFDFLFDERPKRASVLLEKMESLDVQNPLRLDVDSKNKKILKDKVLRDGRKTRKKAVEYEDGLLTYIGYISGAPSQGEWLSGNGLKIMSAASFIDYRAEHALQCELGNIESRIPTVLYRETISDFLSYLWDYDAWEMSENLFYRLICNIKLEQGTIGDDSLEFIYKLIQYVKDAPQNLRHNTWMFFDAMLDKGCEFYITRTHNWHHEEYYIAVAKDGQMRGEGFCAFNEQGYLLFRGDFDFDVYGPRVPLEEKPDHLVRPKEEEWLGLCPSSNKKIAPGFRYFQRSPTSFSQERPFDYYSEV